MTRGGFASAQDVARLAGVSRSAVSRCFTPGASIAPETRGRILAAAETLGYQVNDLARGLIARQSRLVGLVVQGSDVGFRAHLTSELSRALIGRGAIPVLLEIGQSAEDRAAARSVLFGHRAAATIVLSGSPPAEFLDLARLNGQPLIVIGREEPGCDTVRIGDEAAARQAARLFADRGVRRVGVIGSDTATPTLLRRELAFVAEARAQGLDPVSLRGADAVHGAGFEAAGRLLGAQRRPDALFCVNDLLAMGALDAARRLGLAVPGAVQVIGFDDLPEAAWPAYDLTTFRQDPASVARAALDLLDRRQARPGAAAQTRVIEAPLVLRGSIRRNDDPYETEEMP